MDSINVPNYRQIKACFVPQTENRGARIKIFESPRYPEEKTKVVYFSYDYDVDSILNQAIDILNKSGFNPVCRCSECNYYVILCDSWGENFKELKTLKK